MAHRDNEATAPAEFPPEQPEADLAPDDEDYGAEEVELEEEVAEEGAAEMTSEAAVVSGEDAAMAGAVDATAEHVPDDDEMSEDGSVDIEGESEDDEEEEGAAEGDEMDVDMGDAPDAQHQAELMAH